jgi:cellulose biosynthesis protein BcsQ
MTLTLDAVTSDWRGTEGGMRIAVSNLRARTGKTTTALHLAAALAEDGATLLVDADPSRSALSRIEDAGESRFRAVGLPVSNLHRWLGELAEPYEHVVIDTPSGYLGIVCSALLAADEVVIPSPPGSGDLACLRLTVDFAVEVGKLSPVQVRVLLIRMGAARALGAGALLEDSTRPYLMETTVPILEQAGLSMTSPAVADTYREVGGELLGATRGRAISARGRPLRG